MKQAKLLLLAVGLSIVSLFIPSVALAVESSGVGGKPANPREDNPRSSSIFLHELEPGASVRDAVTLANNSLEPKTIEVYPTDSLVASGGAFSCEQKADKADEAGSWITLDKSQTKLEPNQTETVGFTIAVPDDASVGEHNACIAIASVQPATPSDVNGVQLSYRSAIRVAITIPGDISKELEFNSIVITEKGDKLIITQRLTNGGNVSLDTDLATEVGGLLVLTFDETNGEFVMLAGQTVEINTELKRPIWGGFYKVSTVATYNNDVEATLGEQGATTNKLTKSKTIFLMPTAPVTFMYLVLILAVLAPYVLRKQRQAKRKKLLEIAIAHKVKKGDDLTTVAAHYDAEWKQVAWLNGLKPPYKLETGTELFVIAGASYGKTSDTKKPSTSKKSTKKPSSSKE